jgi:ABC-type glycerol-3-phosphate transport system permease component
VLQDPNACTGPLGLYIMKGLYFTDWTGLMSVGLVSILPMLVIFVFFQRYCVRGIARSSMT